MAITEIHIWNNGFHNLMERTVARQHTADVLNSLSRYFEPDGQSNALNSIIRRLRNGTLC